MAYGWELKNTNFYKWCSKSCIVGIRFKKTREKHSQLLGTKKKVPIQALVLGKILYIRRRIESLVFHKEINHI